MARSPGARLVLLAAMVALPRIAAMRDSLDADGVLAGMEESENGVFQFTLTFSQKAGHVLGLLFKPLRGDYCEVEQVITGGLVDRHNNQRGLSPYYTVTIGDRVTQVNEVTGPAAAIDREIKTKVKLKVTFQRYSLQELRQPQQQYASYSAGAAVVYPRKDFPYQVLVSGCTTFPALNGYYVRKASAQHSLPVYVHYSDYPCHHSYTPEKKGWGFYSGGGWDVPNVRSNDGLEPVRPDYVRLWCEQQDTRGMVAVTGQGDRDYRDVTPFEPNTGIKVQEQDCPVTIRVSGSTLQKSMMGEFTLTSYTDEVLQDGRGATLRRPVYRCGSDRVLYWDQKSKQWAVGQKVGDHFDVGIVSRQEKQPVPICPHECTVWWERREIPIPGSSPYIERKHARNLKVEKVERYDAFQAPISHHLGSRSQQAALQSSHKPSSQRTHTAATTLEDCPNFVEVEGGSDGLGVVGLYVKAGKHNDRVYYQTPFPSGNFIYYDDLGVWKIGKWGDQQFRVATNSALRPVPFCPTEVRGGGWLERDGRKDRGNGWQISTISVHPQDESEGATTLTVHVTRESNEELWGLLIAEIRKGATEIRIGKVEEGGVIHRWNLQESQGSDNKVMPGDLITQVNGVTGSAKEMDDEIQRAMEMTMTLKRPGIRQAPAGGDGIGTTQSQKVATKLTRQANKGLSFFTVDSTDRFREGDEVEISDAHGQPEIHAIRQIRSKTLIVLRGKLRRAFLSGAEVVKKAQYHAQQSPTDAQGHAALEYESSLTKLGYSKEQIGEGRTLSKDLPQVFEWLVRNREPEKETDSKKTAIKTLMDLGYRADEIVEGMKHGTASKSIKDRMDQQRQQRKHLATKKTTPSQVVDARSAKEKGIKQARDLLDDGPDFQKVEKAINERGLTVEAALEELFDGKL